MSEIISDDDFGFGSSPSGTESNYTASLGRISGKALAENLERNGIPLWITNTDASVPVLYFDTANKRIGVNAGVHADDPVYDLDVRTDIRTTILNVTSQAKIDNIVVNATGDFTTLTGPINISPTPSSGSLIVLQRMTSSFLEFNNNVIGSTSSSNIVLDPHGAGTVEFQKHTFVTGDVSVTGNIFVDGDLSGDGQLTLGDNIYDTVTVNTDFTQSINPGDDNTYDLGKVNKRWTTLYIDDSTHTNNWVPKNVAVGEQIYFNGTAATIKATQSNDDVFLTPDTGITFIEQTQWQDNTVTNLLNTPLTFASTGTGYLKFAGDSAFVIPAGDSLSRPATPEIGDTRWNTDIQYLECFDGSIYVVATGGGETVTRDYMEDLGNVWTLILG